MRILLEAVLEPVCTGAFIMLALFWPLLLPSQKATRDKMRGKQ